MGESVGKKLDIFDGGDGKNPISIPISCEER
jgi:hypothetical protein